MTERKTTSSLHQQHHHGDVESPAFREMRRQKIDPYLEDIESEAAGAAEAVSKLIALKKRAERSIAIKAGRGVDPQILLHIINHLFTAHAAIKNEKPDWIISDPADGIMHIANAIMKSKEVSEKVGVKGPLLQYLHLFTSIGITAMECLYHIENELIKQEQQTGDDKPETIKKETNEDDTNTDN